MASPCGLGSLTAWHLGSENEYYKKQEAEAAGPLTDQAWNRPCITLSHPITEAAMGPAQIPGEGEKKIHLSKANDKESAFIFNLPHKVEQVEEKADSLLGPESSRNRGNVGLAHIRQQHDANVILSLCLEKEHFTVYPSFIILPGCAEVCVFFH